MRTVTPSGVRVRETRKAIAARQERARLAQEQDQSSQEKARTEAEAELRDYIGGRRGVLSELNSKSQTAGTIQAGLTAFFAVAWFTLLLAPSPKIVSGIVCLGIGSVLSAIALSTLRWLAVAGKKDALYRHNEDVGLRILRETRFERYLRKDEKCSDMDAVVQKRRRLLILVAVFAILGDAVVFGWVLVEALSYL